MFLFYTKSRKFLLHKDWEGRDGRASSGGDLVTAGNVMEGVVRVICNSQIWPNFEKLSNGILEEQTYLL